MIKLKFRLYLDNSYNTERYFAMYIYWDEFEGFPTEFWADFDDFSTIFMK